MWSFRNNNVYKTSNDKYVITAVCSFPNINDTLEKVVDYYRVKTMQKDKKYLEIMSEYYFYNGANFLPLYFEDDCPKLKKLQALQPKGKGWFWCIGYTHDNYWFSEKRIGTFKLKTFEEIYDMFVYWLENYHFEYSSITKWFFEQCVKLYVYKTSPDFDNLLNKRRFDVIENKSLRCITKYIQNDYKEIDVKEKADYIQFIEKMKTRNWYEFVFSEFI